MEQDQNQMLQVHKYLPGVEMMDIGTGKKAVSETGIEISGQLEARTGPKDERDGIRYTPRWSL